MGKTISKTVGIPDAKTYFIDHSLGYIAILRYLEQLPPNSKISEAVLVTDFVRPLPNPQYRILDNFLSTPLRGLPSLRFVLKL